MALNQTQLEILKLFSPHQSEEELQELKSLLISYLASKVAIQADNAFANHEYSADVFEKWKQEHFRKTKYIPLDY